MSQPEPTHINVPPKPRPLLEVVKDYGLEGALRAGLITEAQARQLRDQGY